MKSLYFFLIVFFLVNTVFAQKVTLKGNVFFKNEALSEVELEVLNNDSLLFASKAKRSGKFKLEIEADKEYKILLKKEGFISKIIMLDANLNSDIENIPPFEFDVVLLKEREFRYVDKEMISKPAALIFYNSDLGLLDWDRKITKDLSQELAQAKKLNRELRQKKYSKF